MACDFVGHPVVAEPEPSETQVRAFREKHGLSGQRILLVLPGSRRSEVSRLAPRFGEALRPVLSAVKAVMRLVNRLVAQMAHSKTDDEAAHLLALFLSALQPLQTIPSEVRETIPDLVGFRQQLGPAGMFDRLLAILTTTPDNQPYN